MEGQRRDNSEVYSQKIKAGKRTYFFDVKTTRGNDYYLTITESRKRFKEDGEGHFYEKHKLFLYKEDLNKFLDALNATVAHLKEELLPDYDFDRFDQGNEDAPLAQESMGSETDIGPMPMF